MNLIIVLGIIIGLIVLNLLKVPTIAWLFLWPIAVYLFIRHAIIVNVPASVLTIYMGITILALGVYVITDEERYERVKAQILAFLTEKRFQIPLIIVVLLIPSLVAYNKYIAMTLEVKAPTFGRTIHPNPPAQITFKGETINMKTGKNPYRELETSNPGEFKKHVENGKRVYVQNCVFCHGDDLRGMGMFAHGYNPVPANFNSATTIPQLQEAYLFWRIAKGGPGLPDESGPWSSSMPAWEKFLTADEIWDVILYLFDHTGLQPRKEEEHGH